MCGLNVFRKKKQGLDRIERIKLIMEENLIRLCDWVNGGEKENVKHESLSIFKASWSLSSKSFLLFFLEKRFELHLNISSSYQSSILYSKKANITENFPIILEVSDCHLLLIVDAGRDLAGSIGDREGKVWRTGGLSYVEQRENSWSVLDDVRFCIKTFNDLRNEKFVKLRPK